jgi:hypothetical protein
MSTKRVFDEAGMAVVNVKPPALPGDAPARLLLSATSSPALIAALGGLAVWKITKDLFGGGNAAFAGVAVAAYLYGTQSGGSDSRPLVGGRSSGRKDPRGDRRAADPLPPL